MKIDQGAIRWLYKYAHKNYWRVCSWYDITDLIQDGYLCWYKVVQFYPDVTDRPHMMRLFQVTFVNHVHDLAKGRTGQLDTPIASMLVGDTTEEQFLSRHEFGEHAPTAMAHAIPAVRRIVEFAASHPEKFHSPARRRSGGIRETTNEMLCKLIGLDPQMIDLVAEVKYCLSE